MTIGGALYSRDNGTLIYDSLNRSKKENNYFKVIKNIAHFNYWHFHSQA